MEGARIGRFLVQRRLGTGAMGSVFLAIHPSGGHEVAIKVLHDRDPELVARFRREAELMARIRDPRVVGVCEAGVHEGQLFLAMDYVPGRDLAEVLKERGALPPLEAARLLAEVARGVAAAHEAGVVHRDLKPANVLLDEAGRPKVTDFGVSAGLGARRHSLTETGALVGTPAYMAPEQVRDARSVDARSDVYALGVILYECLSGQTPFRGATSLAILDAVLEGNAEPLPSGLPANLAEVVQTAMALDPGDRYSSASFLADALDECLEGRGAGRTWPLVVSAAGLVALALAGTWASGLWEASAPEVASPTRTPEAPAASSPSPSVAPSASPSATLEPSPTRAPTSVADFGGPRSPELYRERLRLYAASRSALRAESDRGNPLAMTRLGTLGVMGHSQALGRSASLRLLRSAAEAGDPEAMCTLGRVLGSKGEGRPWVQRAARERFPAAMMAYLEEYGGREAILAEAERYAAAGDPSCHAFLIQEALVAGERATVLRRVEAAVAGGVPGARLTRARLLRDSSNPNLEKSLADFAAVAEAGLPEGKCGLARAYALGLGVERDRERARALIAEVKAQGSVGLAEVEEFFLFESTRERYAFAGRLDRRGVPKHVNGEVGLHLARVDPSPASMFQVGRLLERAGPRASLDGRIPALLARLVLEGHALTSAGTPAQLLERAVELGDREGLRVLAECYLSGRGGVAKDPERALELLQRGVKGGDLVASVRLGQLYQGQEGVAPDLARAFQCLERAAEGGVIVGMLELSELCHREGRKEEAARWAIEGAKRYAGRKNAPAEAFDHLRALFYLALDAVRKGSRRDALRWAERGAEAGIPIALSLSARLARSEPKPDWPKIAARYRRAAEAGDPEGRLGYARCLASGRGVARDPAAAAKLRDQVRGELPRHALAEDFCAALEAGDRVTWIEHLGALLELEEEQLPGSLWGDLGLALLDRLDVLPDPDRARHAIARLLSRASPSQSLNPRVPYQAAEHIRHGQIPISNPQQRWLLVAGLYRRASALGHAEGARAYGWCLLNAQGVAKNVAEGVRAIELAAERGSGRAWEGLGDLARDGLPADLAKAEACYRKGAALGVGNCYLKLAELLIRRGNYAEAAEEIRRGMAAGVGEAEILYGESLLQGRGVPADPARGLELLKRHAKSRRACSVLAEAYRRGQGVAVDLKEAERWARRAAELSKRKRGR